MLRGALLVIATIVVGFARMPISWPLGANTQSASVQPSMECLSVTEDRHSEEPEMGDAMTLPAEDFQSPSLPVSERLVASCEMERSAWEDGEIPKDKYWSIWNDHPAPWCSEFVGWNLSRIGFSPGETMPERPACARAYYNFYSKNQRLAEIHENDGTYCPKPGDIVLFDGFTHTEMVTDVNDDGMGWNGISGGSKVRRTHRRMSDKRCKWFITLLWDADNKL